MGLSGKGRRMMGPVPPTACWLPTPTGPHARHLPSSRGPALLDCPGQRSVDKHGWERLLTLRSPSTLFTLSCTTSRPTNLLSPPQMQSASSGLSTCSFHLFYQLSAVLSTWLSLSPILSVADSFSPEEDLLKSHLLRSTFSDHPV